MLVVVARVVRVLLPAVELSLQVVPSTRVLLVCMLVREDVGDDLVGVEHLLLLLRRVVPMVV